MYVYVCVCVCMCMCMYVYIFVFNGAVGYFSKLVMNLGCDVLEGAEHSSVAYIRY